ncbi:TIGR02285 family protein [Paramagnetospirillum kuznetsovii]|nr:TIGR02285 family protein [Paramagnetospirillum kuznetsovii]
MAIGWRSIDLRRGLFRLAVMAAGLSTSGAAALAEDNAVTWLLPDYPPVTISHGPRQGTGYADIFLRYLTEQTPEYAHHRESSSMSRVFGLMQQGQPVCHPSLLKTPEREVFVDFSGPVEFVLPHHIVVRSDRIGRFDAYRNTEGTVDVGRLMKDLGLVTTYQEKRGYPPVVSAALKASAGQKNVIETSADDEGPFRQLAAGWVDYIIAYPDEVNWFAELLRQADTVRFEYLPIAGLAEYTIGHVGCTKGAWGKKIVERVDEIVAKAGTRPVWVDAEARLLDAAAAKRFEDVFARNSPFRPRPR